jgi:UPF0755 protein
MKRFLVLALTAAVLGCGGTDTGDGPTQRVTVPTGAPLRVVADSLEARGIIRSATLFRLYARFSGQAESVQAGTYQFREGDGWNRILDDLTAGRIAADRLVVPEGSDIQQIAPAIARISDRDPDSLTIYMLDTATAARFQVPGPTLEGYLYPATYVIPVGAPVDSMISSMVRHYRRVWTPERRALADSARLSEREVVTLASIVEKEARVKDEMPVMAAVFLNRLEIGMPLQADPTVQYARGVHQNRLLYAHISEVADHPYNTYTQRGIPPGPISSPSTRAVDAVLHPADVNYLYFVARPDGTHVFNRHLEDHNRARVEIRREIDRRQREAQSSARTAP